MRIGLVILAAAPLLAAIPAQAQVRSTAASELQQGDFSRAEATLASELRVYPNRPELLLNMAALYARTGRAAEARALYARVLKNEDAVMDVSAERTASAHTIASRGLRRLETVQFSAR